jgi:hypothetical protein
MRMEIEPPYLRESGVLSSTEVSEIKRGVRRTLRACLTPHLFSPTEPSVSP